MTVRRSRTVLRIRGRFALELLPTSSRRETQSEVGDCNLGRTSCDTDPRLSVDARRISFDCPRASWDGCLLGKACTRLSPMEEDSNSSDNVDLNSYGDGRRSFCVDRSNSRRRRFSRHLLRAKLLITEKELMERYVRPSGDAVKSDCVIESDSSGVRQKGFNKLQKWRGCVEQVRVGSRERRISWRRMTVILGMWLIISQLRVFARGRGGWLMCNQVSSVGHKLMRSYSVSCASPCRMDGLAEDSESKGVF
ncbi:hypothetical protein Fmac_025130 [Flemingia macrophylla]|uniref:Uncharacterized protein n=1 Tax=Flemingia macrophylla TaxID=520843 RepID=A0ABD1LRC0_9FABA